MIRYREMVLVQDPLGQHFDSSNRTSKLSHPNVRAFALCGVEPGEEIEPPPFGSSSGSSMKFTLAMPTETPGQPIFGGKLNQSELMTTYE